VKQPSGRLIRYNSDFAREIADIIHLELKDPRVGHIVSVLKTETSVDLKYCKVYVSILGSPDEQRETFKVLQNASGFIRKRIAERVNPRQTPEIRFIFDDSVEHGFKMDKLIDDVIKRDAAANPGSLDEMRRVLLESNDFVIAAHVNPDSDAVGSCLALGLCLKKLGKRAQVVLDPYHNKNNIIPGQELVWKEGSPEPAASCTSCRVCEIVNRSVGCVLSAGAKITIPFCPRCGEK